MADVQVLPDLGGDRREKLVPQERAGQRIVAQIVGVSVPRVRKEMVEGVKHMPKHAGTAAVEMDLTEKTVAETAIAGARQKGEVATRRGAAEMTSTEKTVAQKQVQAVLRAHITVEGFSLGEIH